MHEELEPLTMSVAHAAQRLGAPEGWYTTQLRAGKLPGHKLGRTWRITEEDLRGALELTSRPASVTAPDPAGLTPGSRRRLERAKLNGAIVR